ncbi:hypothetical protein K431DRAFT_292267 [Polychaeton citri CBS 116435]|uniref:CHCH domain-containing protein n=1 Tax=Polychaeton citri CBS 116435 TaxID=1314669 RepID=A0A9P4QAE5_9PEZI|nr:hypothetical protein K431DRAFT_292267 [Polychaeton citri CBS 116435]
MPRQSRGPAPAPRRPTVPAANQRPAPSQQQTRPASTSAQPPMQHQAPTPQAPMQQPQSSGPGLFGQMASTAAGVAVGSSIGHAIGGFFGGGSSAAPAAPADQPLAQTESGQSTMNSNYQAPKVCETDISNFRRCMDENQGSLSICGWYLDQLKACQAAASQY